MKRITITYHMRRGNKNAETCITVPMADYIADALLENQGDSSLVACGLIWSLLEDLSYLQGYGHPKFICAREDTT